MSNFEIKKMEGGSSGKGRRARIHASTTPGELFTKKQGKKVHILNNTELMKYPETPPPDNTNRSESSKPSTLGQSRVDTTIYSDNLSSMNQIAKYNKLGGIIKRKTRRRRKPRKKKSLKKRKGTSKKKRVRRKRKSRRKVSGGALPKEVKDIKPPQLAPSAEPPPKLIYSELDEPPPPLPDESPSPLSPSLRRRHR